MDKAIQSIDDLADVLNDVESHCQKTGRPFVTVTYAQSIDGSIATRDRRPLRISGSASMRMTHQLRALNDGILVGIETVLADNPRLSVRLVEGSNPQPVVLDTRLRTPIDAHLLEREDQSAWLVTSGVNATERVDAVSRAGATVLPCGLDEAGRVDLRELMGKLYEKGMRSLMVEGGARVITSFIHARAVDLFVITISPMLIGGLQVVEARQPSLSRLLQLSGIHYEHLEDDLVLWAKPLWNHP